MLRIMDEVIVLSSVEDQIVQFLSLWQVSRLPSALEPQRFAWAIVAVRQHSRCAGVVTTDVLVAVRAHSTFGFIGCVVGHFGVDSSVDLFLLAFEDGEE